MDQVDFSKFFIRRLNLEISYCLVRPRYFSRDKSYPLFVYVHGYSDDIHSLFSRYDYLFKHRDYFLVFPQAPLEVDVDGRIGYSWYRKDSQKILMSDLKRSGRVIDEVIVHLKSDYNFSRYALGGFSQGGRIAYYCATDKNNVFDRIIPVAGTYMDDFDKGLDNLAEKKVHIFHGTRDEVNDFSVSQSVYQKLVAEGIAATFDIYDLDHSLNEKVVTKILDRVED